MSHFSSGFWKIEFCFIWADRVFPFKETKYIYYLKTNYDYNLLKAREETADGQIIYRGKQLANNFLIYAVSVWV